MVLDRNLARVKTLSGKWREEFARRLSDFGGFGEPNLVCIKAMRTKLDGSEAEFSSCEGIAS